MWINLECIQILCIWCKTLFLLMVYRCLMRPVKILMQSLDERFEQNKVYDKSTRTNNNMTNVYESAKIKIWIMSNYTSSMRPFSNSIHAVGCLQSNSSFIDILSKISPIDKNVTKWFNTKKLGLQPTFQVKTKVTSRCSL